MSVMGVKIDKFEVPFCNSFRPKIVMDQLCYTVDPNKYRDNIDLKGYLSLSLLINFNEEKEMSVERFQTLAKDKAIIIETIGKINNKLKS